MPDINDQLQKKKPFKKKTYRSYLSLDETLEDVDSSKTPIEVTTDDSTIEQNRYTSETAENINTQNHENITSESMPLKYEQKKIKREGPTHPYQEKLPQYQVKESIENETSNKLVTTSSEFPVDKNQSKNNSRLENKVLLNPTKSVITNESSTPTLDIPFSDDGHLKISTTNLQQTYNEPTAQPISVLQQTYNNSEANVQQTYNRKSESCNKLTTHPTTVVQQIPTTVVQQNLQQLYNNNEANVQQTYNRKSGVNLLTGYGLNLLNALFSICISNGNRITGPVNINTLTGLASVVNSKTTQTILYRLETSGYIKRESFKVGRGGWTSYEIPYDIYNQLLQLTTKPTTVVQKNLQQTYNIPTTQPTTQHTTNLSSKIDSNKYNTKLTNSEEFEENKSFTQNTTFNGIVPFSADWFKNLDFTPVSPIRPMSVNSSIRKLVQEKLQPEQVQEFLNRFKSWLATQQKILNPLAIFCDRLKEYAQEGDSAILYAMTEEDREIEAKLLEENERVRSQMMLIQKAKTERVKLDAEEQFESWYQTASDEDLMSLIKPSDLSPFRSGIYKLSAKAAFLTRLGIVE